MTRHTPFMAVLLLFVSCKGPCPKEQPPTKCPPASQVCKKTKAHAHKKTTAKAAAAKKTRPAPPLLRPLTAFTGGTLHTGLGGKPIENGLVVLNGSTIAYSGPHDESKIPVKARRVQCHGKHLVPGLIDAHMHLFQSGGIYTRPDIMDLRGIRPYKREFALIKERLRENLRRTLAAGVTAQVDVGGPMWNFTAREKSQGWVLSPRLAVAGPLVSTVARPQFDPADLPIIKVSTPDETRRLVKRQLAKKPDLIKVWFIVDPKKGMEPGLPVLREAITASHQAKVRVIVHATQLEAARKAVELGADILAHSVDDKLVDAAFVKLLKERGTILIPTLVVYEGYSHILSLSPKPTNMDLKYGDPLAMESWRQASVATGGTPRQAARRLAAFKKRMPIMAKNLMLLHKGGVLIAAGTDAGNVGTLHGTSLHRELALMVRAGMTPTEAMASATRVAARVFSVNPRIGTIQKGNFADMLILEKDPTKNIAHLQHIHRLVKGGRVIDPKVYFPPNPEWLAQAQLEAYNARDVDRFVSYYAKDVKVYSHPSGKLMMEGRETMRNRYRAYFKKSPRLHCRVYSRIVNGPFVIDRELVTGGRGKDDITATAMYEVQNGLIAKVWFLPLK